ncbi:MAG TPA: hypothetical protein VNL77_18955 [Roseiflexaceae bacterium]|nr:hypothetical protein [Roseiflexaceae bacterium]
MANVKTAISLQEELFERAEAAAREMNVSRSRLVAMALEEFIRKRENRKLAEQIDAAYGEGLDDEERAWLAFGRQQMYRRFEADDQ